MYIQKYRILLYKIVIYLLIILIPFQDFFLKNTSLNMIGTNASLILVYVFFFFFLLSNKKIILSKKYLLITLIIFFLSFYFLLNVNLFVFNNTNMFIKIIKNIVFYSQIIIVFYIFNKIYIDYPKLIISSLNIVSFIYILFIIYMIIYYLFGYSLDTNNIIHASKNGNMRFRLFSYESSMGVVVFLTYGLLTLLNDNKNKFLRILIIISIMFGLSIFQSKGAIIVMILIVFLLLNSFKNVIIFILAISIISTVYIENIINYLSITTEGINQYSSFSTRVGMIFASILSLFYHPLGTGIGTYIYTFNDMIIQSINILTDLFNKIGLVPIFYEMEMYLHTSKSYGTKSLLFDSIMMLGWIGLYIYLKFIYRVWNKVKLTKNLVIKVLFIYLTFTQSFLVDSSYLYEFWFAYALIYNYWRLNEKKHPNCSK